MRPNDMPRPFAPDHSEGTTHGEGCHTWGPRHYECAMRELARLRLEVKGLRWNAARDTARILELEGRERDVKAETTIVFAQRDELRRRIAEAERFDAAMLLALGIPVSQDDAFAAFALVRLDAEEGK